MTTITTKLFIMSQLVLFLAAPVWAGSPKTSAPAPASTGPKSTGPVHAPSLNLARLKQSLKDYPGRIIELEKESETGTTYYKIKLLTEQGKVIQLHFQTDTGKIIQVKSKHKDKALSLLKQPILPLERFLAQISPGEVLEVELKLHNGKAVYEVKWLDKQGEIRKQSFDALTARAL